MRIAWTILMTALLAFLPAGGSLSFAAPVTDAGSGCARCQCCIQPSSAPAPAQNAPLAPAGSSVSVERFAREVDPAVLPPTPRVVLAATRSDLNSLPKNGPVPIFTRFCSFLI